MAMTNRERRQQLAKLSFSEKVRILTKLRKRSLALRPDADNRKGRSERKPT
jgi:hypothetical protein